MTKIIELQDIWFQYESDQETYQLADVSFHVKQGEWLSIVGHNGSGKSTTVRLIDGLLEATKGDILLFGDPLTIDNVIEKRRHIGMVFQNPDNQFVGATVEDDVAFGLENQGVPRSEMLERVQTALEAVGMWEFRDREPARLSGGQKQRVAIAGILALRPEILILDEATSMLDPEGRLELIRLVQDVKKEHQMTVLSITHDLDEVALSDRVLVMKEGRVESETRPAELFMRADLAEIGLRQPFTAELTQRLHQAGLALENRYYDEKELQEVLWALHSKR